MKAPEHFGNAPRLMMLLQSNKRIMDEIDKKKPNDKIYFLVSKAAIDFFLHGVMNYLALKADETITLQNFFNLEAYEDPRIDELPFWIMPEYTVCSTKEPASNENYYPFDDHGYTLFKINYPTLRLPLIPRRVESLGNGKFSAVDPDFHVLLSSSS